MNTPNNKRKRDSQEKIESEMMRLIQKKPLRDITVTELCANANVNRSTFYANYVDIDDLVETIGAKLADKVAALYQNADLRNADFDFERLLQNIYDDPLVYKTYFMLGLDELFHIEDYGLTLPDDAADKTHLSYRVRFFRSGLNAMLKQWLFDDCPFPPDEFMRILRSEYWGRVNF